MAAAFFDLFSRYECNKSVNSIDNPMRIRYDITIK